MNKAIKSLASKLACWNSDHYGFRLKEPFSLCYYIVRVISTLVYLSKTPYLPHVHYSYYCSPTCTRRYRSVGTTIEGCPCYFNCYSISFVVNLFLLLVCPLSRCRYSNHQYQSAHTLWVLLLSNLIGLINS